MKTALTVAAAATVLLAPSGEIDREWLAAKAKSAGVELAAVGATRGVTEVLKSATGRERPNGENDESFPSGHASQSAATALLASRNVHAMDVPGWVKGATDVTAGLAATSVAWARVEGEKHYPLDVLAGLAIGNFLAAFVHDAFLGFPDDRAHLGVTVGPGVAGLALDARF